MEITQNLIAIFVTFSMGLFFGALWMFFKMYSELKSIQKELDTKRPLDDTDYNILNEKANI
tara:strand:- start:1209 stop:1391 length:183 start_codon:yes stop_codon:yes gene_type:complete